MSENRNYILHNGKLQYEVTPEVQKVLEGAILGRRRTWINTLQNFVMLLRVTLIILQWNIISTSPVRNIYHLRSK